MKVYAILELCGDEIGAIEAIFLTHANAIAYLEALCKDGHGLQTRQAGETYPYSQEIVYDTSRNTIDFFTKKPAVYTESWQILEFEAKD